MEMRALTARHTLLDTDGTIIVEEDLDSGQEIGK